MNDFTKPFEEHPVMTSPNTPPPAPPKRNRLTRWKLPALMGAAGIAVGGLLATGITMAVTDEPATRQSECVTAIGHADEAIDLYSGAFTDAADALDSYMAYDYSAMDGSTSNLNHAATDLEPVLMDYYRSSDQCLGAN